jgi:hypothetical protein
MGYAKPAGSIEDILGGIKELKAVQKSPAAE